MLKLVISREGNLLRFPSLYYGPFMGHSIIYMRARKTLNDKEWFILSVQGDCISIYFQIIRSNNDKVYIFLLLFKVLLKEKIHCPKFCKRFVNIDWHTFRITLLFIRGTRFLFTQDRWKRLFKRYFDYFFLISLTALFGSPSLKNLSSLLEQNFNSDHFAKWVPLQKPSQPLEVNPGIP